MALKWTQIGVLPDGSPWFTVESDLENPHILLTGPEARGVVRTSDGTSYDVTAPALEVQSPEHAGEIAHLIAVQHEQAGRYSLSPEPVHDDEGDLVSAPHECTDGCGAFKVDRDVHVAHIVKKAL